MLWLPIRARNWSTGSQNAVVRVRRRLPFANTLSIHLRSSLSLLANFTDVVYGIGDIG